jgi:hypothetical protein
MGTILKYYNMGTVLKYYNMGTILKYYAMWTVLKYYNMGTILKYYNIETKEWSFKWFYVMQMYIKLLKVYYIKLTDLRSLLSIGLRHCTKTLLQLNREECI